MLGLHEPRGFYRRDMRCKCMPESNSNGSSVRLAGDGPRTSWQAASKRDKLCTELVTCSLRFSRYGSKHELAVIVLLATSFISATYSSVNLATEISIMLGARVAALCSERLRQTSFRGSDASTGHFLCELRYQPFDMSMESYRTNDLREMTTWTAYIGLSWRGTRVHASMGVFSRWETGCGFRA